MDDGTRFLILSLCGDGYAISITRVLEITVRRGFQKDTKLNEIFEGRIEYRGTWIPVLNIKKVFNVEGMPGETLLVIKSSKGAFGMLVDTVTEILDAEQKPVPLPPGVVRPGLQYFSGVLRHKENLVLLLNEDGLLP